MLNPFAVTLTGFTFRAETLLSAQSDPLFPVVLSCFCEGSRKQLVCSLMFLMLTKGKVVEAETLLSAQSDRKNIIEVTHRW